MYSHLSSYPTQNAGAGDLGLPSGARVCNSVSKLSKIVGEYSERETSARIWCNWYSSALYLEIGFMIRVAFEVSAMSDEIHIPEAEPEVAIVCQNISLLAFVAIAVLCQL